jgi:DNA polymerase IIIc chi subunit
VTSCTFHDTEEILQDRRLFEIVEREYNRRVRVVVFAGSPERAAAIDRLLWITRQEAFIPHENWAGRNPDPLAPVAIVTTEQNPIGAAVLVADGHCSLEFAAGFETIHEFVKRSSPQLHEACRQRFRAYRERHIPVQHLK